jgi:hypothetical protein
VCVSILVFDELHSQRETAFLFSFSFSFIFTVLNEILLNLLDFSHGTGARVYPVAVPG